MAGEKIRVNLMEIGRKQRNRSMENKEKRTGGIDQWRRTNRKEQVNRSMEENEQKRTGESINGE